MPLFLGPYVTRISYPDKGYLQWTKKPRAYSSLTAANARPTASTRASRVRALARRGSTLIFLKASSIGLKSGEEYEDRNKSPQPRVSINLRTRSPLWAATLSRTITCLGDRRARMDMTAERTEAQKVSLYRPDGSKVYGEEEHADRIVGIAQE